MIRLDRLQAGYTDTPVLHDISLHIPAGSITALIGPNGCGKTTLLRTLCGLLSPSGGGITIDGKALSQFCRKELAQKVAILPQTRDIPALSVETLVQHGRYPHLGMSRKLTQKDLQAVADALEKTDMTALSQCPLRELSGGQRQRAYVAMALAQDAEIILLDEPTTHLDLGRQFELLSLIQSLQKDGKTVIMVLHDLEHALRYCDRLVLLENGRLVQSGTPEELLQSGALAQVFDITIQRAGDGYLFRPAQPAVGSIVTKS